MKEKRFVDRTAGGTLAAFLAYGIWGIFPFYWKQLKAVDALQILGHRFIWAAAFCVVVLALSGRLSMLGAVFANRRQTGRMMLAAFLICVNWGVYIMAVNTGRVTESALGYYINPLFSVALGVLFAGEKLDAGTGISMLVATLGIVGAAVVYGSIPWTSLILASSFGFYGLLKKKAGLEPMVSLAIETLLVSPFALAYLLYRQTMPNPAFISAGSRVTILLVLAGLVTAIPLLLFAKAANSIPLQRMGFIQYLSPTLQLAIGILAFGEKPGKPLLVTLVSVVAAVAIYVFSRKHSRG
ncbi:MAG: EamA family transporter RarD [Rectinemataceae bacterium]|nr:EamA family transporter RarD [Rectinemataceae bacterium]